MNKRTVSQAHSDTGAKEAKKKLEDDEGHDYEEKEDDEAGELSECLEQQPSEKEAKETEKEPENDEGHDYEEKVVVVAAEVGEWLKWSK